MPLASHAERLSVRAAINGQPNGYKPVSEAELQDKHLAKVAESLSRLQNSKFRFHLRMVA